MSIYSVLGIAVVSVAAALLIKKDRPELALLISLMASVIIFLAAFQYIKEIKELIEYISLKAGIEISYIRLVLKVIAIAYLGEIASGLCKDAGETAVGVKVEMATKLIILSMCIPVIKALLTLLLGII